MTLYITIKSLFMVLIPSLLYRHVPSLTVQSPPGSRSGPVWPPPGAYYGHGASRGSCHEAP